MLRQCAFGDSKPLLKGNLHLHTTRSDGDCTPEEAIRAYAESGYDFLALTDHRRYNYKNFSDLPITIIPGMEIDRRFKGEEDWKTNHCFHSVVIGPPRERGNGFAQDEYVEGGFVDGQEEYQLVLDEMHARGNLTTICHPQWSATPPRQFEKLKGCFAMEIRNSGTLSGSACDEDNGLYWDELLVQGKKIFAYAADDCHHVPELCLSWIYVNAENTVEQILTALKNGAFYSSTGAKIHDFYVDEERQAHLLCDDAQYIVFYYGLNSPRKRRYKDGTPIREGILPIPEYASYVRAKVVDLAGNLAWTNPIILRPEAFSRDN